MNNKIKYPFDESGIKFFISNMYDSIFEIMDKGAPWDNEDTDIYIRVGCHEIRLPDVAMNYQLLEEYLKDAWEEYNL